MSEMTEDEFEAAAERVVTDATLAVLAAEIDSWLPPWCRDLADEHSAEVLRLRAVGDPAAAVWEAHRPMLMDGCGEDGESYGIGCLNPHLTADDCEDPQPYPCAVLRALPGGSRVWDDIVRRYR